jgi:hypothetical protein
MVKKRWEPLHTVRHFKGRRLAAILRGVVPHVWRGLEFVHAQPTFCDMLREKSSAAQKKAWRLRPGD